MQRFPGALKAQNRWVISTRKGVPHTPFPPFEIASCNKPADWGDYETVMSNRWGGCTPGYALGDGVAGIDIDLPEGLGGLLPLWAIKIIKQMNSYTERSPSGEGLHIFVQGVLQHGKRRKQVGGGEVEVYGRSKFLRCTGEHLPSTPLTVEPRQAELDRLVESLTVKPRSSGFIERPTNLDLVKLSRSRTYQDIMGGKWERWGNDRSRVDAALFRLLWNYLGGDVEAARGLMMTTPLFRPKWNRASYWDSLYGMVGQSKSR